MIPEITESIQNTKVMRIWYHPGERVIEPHALGVTKDGHHVLRAWQRSGASASHEHENWKLFRLDRTDDVEPMGQSFDGPRPGYNPDDKAMKRGFIARL